MGVLFRAGSVGIDRLVGGDAGGVSCIVERKAGYWPKPRTPLEGRQGGWTRLLHWLWGPG